MRILVVDDDDPGRYLAATILRGYGHEVLEARNGQEALEVARAQAPDAATAIEVVLTDILMPTMDGYALCREWKADPALRQAPLIFYTATYTDPEDESFATTLGADGFVTKPQEPERLVQLIAEMVGAETGSTRLASDADEAHVLREYNERLVAKLERKVMEADRANEDLRQALEVLSDEVGVKNKLIEKLTSDVAEQQERAGDIAASYEQLDAVVRDCPAPVIALDAEGRITVWNPAAERLFGFTPAESIRYLVELAGDEPDLARRLLSGEVDPGLRVRRSHNKAGDLLEYSYRVTPLHGASGRPKGMIAVVTDWREVPEES